VSLRALVVAPAVLVVALATTGVPSTFASESLPARLGLTPVRQPGLYFDLTLSPGATRHLEVELANFGGEAMLARTYAADVYSIVNGGFGANLFAAQGSGTTLWLDYPTQELRLEAGGALMVDFQLEVPVGTPPGQYVTSLVAENVEPFQGSGGSVALKQVNRVAIAVAINVPGPRHPALEIGAVSFKSAGGVSFVSFAVANPGNVHLRPAGEFILRDSDWTELVRRGVTMDSVYADTDTRLETPLSEPLSPGVYCAELRLTDEATEAGDHTSCLPFTVAAATQAGGLVDTGPSAVPLVQLAPNATPYQPALLLVAVAILLVLAVLLLLLLRTRRRSRTPPPP
jgi:hypothetical protein